MNALDHNKAAQSSGNNCLMALVGTPRIPEESKFAVDDPYAIRTKQETHRAQNENEGEADFAYHLASMCEQNAHDNQAPASGQTQRTEGHASEENQTAQSESETDTHANATENSPSTVGDNANGENIIRSAVPGEVATGQMPGNNHPLAGETTMPLASSSEEPSPLPQETPAISNSNLNIQQTEAAQTENTTATNHAIANENRSEEGMAVSTSVEEISTNHLTTASNPSNGLEKEKQIDTASISLPNPQQQSVDDTERAIMDNLQGKSKPQQEHSDNMGPTDNQEQQNTEDNQDHQRNLTAPLSAKEQEMMANAALIKEGKLAIEDPHTLQEEPKSDGDNLMHTIDSMTRTTTTTETSPPQIGTNYMSTTFMDVHTLRERFDMLALEAMRTEQNQIRVQLEPVALGKLTITCKETTEGMELTINAQSEEVKHLLMQQEQTLRSSLESQGLQLGNFSVSTEDRQQAFRDPTTESEPDYISENIFSNEHKTQQAEQQTDTIQYINLKRNHWVA